MRRWKDSYEKCMFAEKHYAKNLNGEIHDCVVFEPGTFPVVYCMHDDILCDCDIEGCVVKDDHDRE